MDVYVLHPLLEKLLKKQYGFLKEHAIHTIRM